MWHPSTPKIDDLDALRRFEEMLNDDRQKRNIRAGSSHFQTVQMPSSSQDQIPSSSEYNPRSDSKRPLLPNPPQSHREDDRSRRELCPPRNGSDSFNIDDCSASSSMKATGDLNLDLSSWLAKTAKKQVMSNDLRLFEDLHKIFARQGPAHPHRKGNVAVHVMEYIHKRNSGTGTGSSYKDSLEKYKKGKTNLAKIMAEIDASNEDFVAPATVESGHSLNSANSSSVISEKIKKFVVDLDKIEPENLTSVERALAAKLKNIRNDMMKHSATIDKDSLSLVANFDVFPPSIHRRGYNQLRPIVVDACSVAFFYNSDFLHMWLRGNTTDEPFDAGRILPVKPLIDLAVECTSMGHKVFIVLPRYYEVPEIHDKCKVSDLKAFTMLVNLELVKFIDPTPVEADIFLAIQKFAEEKGGCLISHPDLEKAYRMFRGEAVYVSGMEEGKNDTDVYLLSDLEVSSHKRILPLHFAGPENTLIFSPYVNIWCGTNRKDHQNKKTTYHYFDTELMLTYKHTNEIKDEKQFEMQLTFGDQLRILLALSDLTVLGPSHIAAIQMLGRIAFESLTEGEHTTAILTYLAEHSSNNSLNNTPSKGDLLVDLSNIQEIPTNSSASLDMLYNIPQELRTTDSLSNVSGVRSCCDIPTDDLIRL